MKNSSSRLNKFIEKANKIHNYKYDYSKSVYKGSEEQICIICPIHGEFWQRVSHHIDKKGCKYCGKKILSLKEIIIKLNNVHNFRYNYSLINSIDRNEKIKIICPIHGIFEQRLSYHLIGGNCKKCSDLNNNYKKSDWINRAKNKIGIFYIIKCWNENEGFYKIGITFNSIKTRYGGRMPYNYEIIQEIKSDNLEYIWNLEKYFKNYINKQKLHYIPNIKFGGSELECYKL